MRISIYSIQDTLFDGQAEKLIVNTPAGQIAVLENHLPIITKVAGPYAEILGKNGRETVYFSSGILEVRPHSHAVILAEK